MGLKVLHCFDHYLPETEIWAYNLISKIPDVENHIAAKIFLENKGLDITYPQFRAKTEDLEKEQRSTAWRKHPIRKLKLKTQQGFTISYVDELIGYIKKNKIDLVHAHFGNVAWSVMDLTKETDVPLIVSFYGYDYNYLPFTEPKWLKRYTTLFDAAVLFLTEGDQGKNALIEMGCPVDKIQVQRLGIDLGEEVNDPIGKNSGALRLVQIASFAEKKGQTASVEAFAKAHKKCPNLTMDLIGDVRDQAYFEGVTAMIKQYGLEEKITIKHFVEYEKLNEVLNTYEAFIHPSCFASNRDCEGGAPTIMFNAAASGLPIISTKHCDIPAVVLDQKTGLLTKEKDIEGLAKNIETFYNMDQKTYEQYAVASRQHIYANFSLDKNSSELREKYVQALS